MALLGHTSQPEEPATAIRVTSPHVILVEELPATFSVAAPAGSGIYWDIPDGCTYEATGPTLTLSDAPVGDLTLKAVITTGTLQGDQVVIDQKVSKLTVRHQEARPPPEVDPDPTEGSLHVVYCVEESSERTPQQATIYREMRAPGGAAGYRWVVLDKDELPQWLSDVYNKDGRGPPLLVFCDINNEVLGIAPLPDSSAGVKELAAQYQGDE